MGKARVDYVLEALKEEPSFLRRSLLVTGWRECWGNLVLISGKDGVESGTKPVRSMTFGQLDTKSLGQ